MRLESLRIQGFKSFGDKVELVFKPGIIAIVGPNGCGKSNITDAIRWVFGEQSAKSLRGSQMGDVIFNGSSCRKPVGMADVSLKLTNLGSLSVPYQEVVISRRIFRSGEAEYFINKNPCRLKDIVDLFLDTALGKGAYSIVEQGKVDFVVTAKPKERRFLIESAAGIMKYKARKEDALKKMEATRQNLQRLEDIFHEVEKQKENLFEQAKRTKIYKGYRSREDLLVQSIAVGQYLLLKKGQEELGKKLGQWKDKQIALKGNIIQYNNELEAIKAHLIDDEEQISFWQEKVYSLENQVNSLSQHKQSYIKEADRLLEEETNIKVEISDLEATQAQIGADLLAAEKLLAEKERLFLERQERLNVLEGECSVLQKTIQEKKRLYEIRRKDLLGLTNQEARLEHLCETLRERQKDLQGKFDGLEHVFQRLEEDLQRKSEEGKNLQDHIVRQKRFLEECEGEEGDLLLQIEHKSMDLEDIEGRVRELDKNLQSEKTRLFSLKEIFERKEGYQASVKHLLLAKEEQQEELAGLQGVIAELISVPAEYEKAVEAVLDYHIQWMVVDTFEDGLMILKYLQSQRIGRGTFMAKENIFSPSSPKVGQEIQSLNIPGVIGPALQVIRYASRYTKVMEYFFGNTILVEDITGAKEVLNKFSGWYRLVTSRGEIVTSYGMISGGESGKTSPGFLAQKRLIEELHASIPLLEKKLETEESLRKQVMVHIEKLRQEKERLNQRHHQLEIAVNGLQKDLSHLKSQKELCHKRIEELDYKKDRIKADEKELAENLKNHQERLERIRAEKARIEKGIESFSIDLESLGRQEKDSQDRVTESKIDLTSLDGQQKTLRVNLGHGEKSRDSNAKKLTNLKKRGEKISLDQKENKHKLSDLENQIPQLKKEHEVSINKLKMGEIQRHEKTALIKETEQKLKRAQQAYNRMDLKIKEIELRQTEILTHMNHILEDKGLTEDHIFSLEADSIITEDQIQKLQERLYHIKEQIVSLGTVNLMAIDEYNQLLERYGFLCNQREDLTNSLNSLHSLIDKINQDSCVRFKQTFETINTNFQAMFKRLFNGGYAELLLEQPEDFLETGIEVVVQPPGKKAQFLSLLSGGEKAMTAIALIFAIYLLKPSPFCLLDEIDASLDDANIDRFINLLDDFKQRTQFLLITHSKKTIQVANVIYGVTMETPGLSKIVSLELNKIKKGK